MTLNKFRSSHPPRSEITLDKTSFRDAFRVPPGGPCFFCGGALLRARARATNTDGGAVARNYRYTAYYERRSCE